MLAQKGEHLNKLIERNSIIQYKEVVSLKKDQEAK